MGTPPPLQNIADVGQEVLTVVVADLDSLEASTIITQKRQTPKRPRSPIWSCLTYKQ